MFENKIPEGFKPLIDKISKNLSDEDLQLLSDIVNKKITPSPDVVKKLGSKMVSGLNAIEKLRFTKMLLYLNIKR